MTKTLLWNLLLVMPAMFGQSPSQIADILGTSSWLEHSLYNNKDGRRVTWRWKLRFPYKFYRSSDLSTVCFLQVRTVLFLLKWKKSRNKVQVIYFWFLQNRSMNMYCMYFQFIHSDRAYKICQKKMKISKLLTSFRWSMTRVPWYLLKGIIRQNVYTIMNKY